MPRFPLTCISSGEPLPEPCDLRASVVAKVFASTDGVSGRAIVINDELEDVSSGEAAQVDSEPTAGHRSADAHFSDRPH
jgi:hypothetical protein